MNHLQEKRFDSLDRRSEKRPMNCAEFQEQLPQLSLTDENLSQHEHLATCENCAALVRDLEYIVEQAKLLMPLHDPGQHVWEGINSAISREGGELGTGR